MRLLVISLLVVPSLVQAQTPSVPAAPATATVSTSQADPRPSVCAVLRRDPIVIDGRLDEAAWSAAEVISNFHQQ